MRPVGPNCTQTQFNNNGNPLLLPNYQSILAYESIGRGNYDALQIAVEKRFKRGLEFTSNFTWSKNLDQSSQASIPTCSVDLQPIQSQRGLWHF